FVLNSFILADPIVPRSVILIDLALSILATGVLRAGTRCYIEMIRPLFEGGTKKRSLIFGTDRAGIGILRALQAADSEFQVVGFIDDGCKHRNSLIGGIAVHSIDIGWDNLAKKLAASDVLIPSFVPAKLVRKIVEACAQA